MTKTTIQMFDRAPIGNFVRRTSDGYVTAVARVARTGIQIYDGAEVGKPEMEKVRVWRPEEEVFDEDSMRSYAHRPVTNDHPKVAVNSKNWKKFAVGYTGDGVIRDGDHIQVPLVLMDDGAIKDFDGGKKQLSQGYTCDLVWQDGVTPAGEPFDAIQTKLRMNHLAVVTDARGGPRLRIGDCHEGEEEMNDRTTTVLIDGLSVELTPSAAQVVQKALADMSSKLSEASKKVKEAEDELAALKKKEQAGQDSLDAGKKQIEAKDAEITTLKKQVEDSKLTPAKLDDMVKARAQIADKAYAVLGDALAIDGKTDHEIRKQVVDSKLGDAAKGWNENQIAASFETITASVGDGNRRESLDSALSFGAGRGRFDDAEKAYEDRDRALSNAWRNPDAYNRGETGDDRRRRQ